MTPYTWNADREYHGGGSATTQIGGGWRNYIKRGYVWQPISALIAGDLSCTTFPGNVQFAASSQGWSDIVIDGTFSMTRHIAERNGHNAEPELRLSMQVECDHNVAGEVDEDRPWQVVYRGAWDCADLRLGIWQGKAARIEEVFDIHSMPSGDSEFVEYSFNIRSSHARVFAGPNLDVSPWDGRHAELFDAQAFVSRADSQLRGVLLKTPVAWYYTADGTEVRTPIRVTFEIQDDGETVRCTKHIPRALIATALVNGSRLKADATFSPDSNPETTSIDGRVMCDTSSQYWSVKIAASGTGADDANAFTYLGLAPSSLSPRYDEFWYPIFLLDTSSIGAGQQVDAATLDLHTSNAFPSNDDLGISTNIYGQVVASNTALASSDYDGNSPTTPFTDNPRDVKSESGTAQYITHTFNAAGKAAVNIEGVSSFCLCLVQARENGAAGDPTWSGSGTKENRLVLRASEAGTNVPLLTVTHSAVSSFGAWYAAANPSGY
jgi:hypothetical protein